MSRYYPIYLDISGKLCLVVGGGAVAERKVNGLREAGARVRVVSPALTPGLAARRDRGEIEVLAGFYTTSCLDGVCLVFAATDDRAVNAQVAAEAAARSLPVNVADAPEEGDFVVPSVVRRGELCVSVSTGGNNPMLAARLSDELEARFGPEYGDFVELLGRMRAYIKDRAEAATLRRQALSALLDAEAPLRALLRDGRPEEARRLAEATVTAALEHPRPE